MKTSKLALGILGAAAVGAALGVLFAPEKGSDTRKKIASKGNDLKGSIKDGVNNFMAKATEKLNTLKSQTENIKNEAKDEINLGLENLKSINKSVM